MKLARLASGHPIYPLPLISTIPTPTSPVPIFPRLPPPQKKKKSVFSLCDKSLPVKTAGSTTPRPQWGGGGTHSSRVRSYVTCLRAAVRWLAPSKGLSSPWSAQITHAK